eukprot:gene12866-biopygen6507
MDPLLLSDVLAGSLGLRQLTGRSRPASERRKLTSHQRLLSPKAGRAARRGHRPHSESKARDPPTATGRRDAQWLYTWHRPTLPPTLHQPGTRRVLETDKVGGGVRNHSRSASPDDRRLCGVACPHGYDRWY